MQRTISLRQIIKAAASRQGGRTTSMRKSASFSKMAAVMHYRGFVDACVRYGLEKSAAERLYKEAGLGMLFRALGAGLRGAGIGTKALSAAAQQALQNSGAARAAYRVGSAIRGIPTWRMRSNWQQAGQVAKNSVSVPPRAPVPIPPPAPKMPLRESEKQVLKEIKVEPPKSPASNGTSGSAGNANTGAGAGAPVPSG